MTADLDPAIADGACPWAPRSDALYARYHDTEWGVPEYDDRALFEKLVLDGFQAGLSWRTILAKRENFRAAFDGFEPERIARYEEAKVAALLQDAGIVRSRSKVEGAVASARAYLALMETEPDGFSGFLWSFVGGRPIRNAFRAMDEVPAKTPESEAMAKALKRRGFKFCGPVICYAFMQACGLVNDHLTTCVRRDEVARLSR